VLSRALGRAISYRELTFGENKDAMIAVYSVPGRLAAPVLRSLEEPGPPRPCLPLNSPARRAPASP
jgi:hypothetical protein